MDPYRHSNSTGLEQTAPEKTGPELAEDAIWVLSSTIIIFTMQSGFGLLESGMVGRKDEVNIMMKNAIDVIVGGLSYWLFGYAFSFGKTDGYANGFNGWGDFLLVRSEEGDGGSMYAHFFFQSSFATTATTIVSGAMAERVKLQAYIIFSFLNTIVYCFPAHWVFRWGWLGFNCGSTLGVFDWKWQSAARSAVSTMNAATGGGLVAMVVSYIALDRKIDVCYFISGVLGSLVSITAYCALAEPWEGFVIDVVGAAFTLAGNELLKRLVIDDPVGCVGVHAFAAVWGLLAVGLFLKKNPRRQHQLGINHITVGLLYGGSVYMLCIQLLGIVAIIAWTIVTSYVFLKCIDLTLGLRVSVEDELLGAYSVMHGLTDFPRGNGSVVTVETPDEENVNSVAVTAVCY